MYIVGSSYLTWKLKLLFIVSVCVILFPFLFGLVGMIFSSLGVTLTWSHKDFSFMYVKSVFTDKNVLHSLFEALIRGNIIGLITLVLVFFIGFFCAMGTNKYVQKLNVFFLTVPHVALATGILFLIAPSGLFFRLLAPFFHWTHPPHVVSVNDVNGIAMSFVVLLKIVPFVLFSFISAFSDYNIALHITQARLMGRNRFAIWTFVIFPQVMPKFILPFFIALAYAISPVDISTIIGPYTPPSFGVRLINDFLRADRLHFIYANIASFILMCTTFISIILWYIIFVLIRKLLQKCYCVVQNIPDFSFITHFIGGVSFIVILSFTLVSVFLLGLWSFVHQWHFPAVLPSFFTFDHFSVYSLRLIMSFCTSLFLAVASALVSLLFVVIILEYIQHMKNKIVIAAFIMLPLLIPQIVYVAGVHMLFLLLNINGSFGALVWSHMQYIVPYMFLVLYGPFQAFDNRYVLQGRMLGRTVLKSLFFIKIPMLLRPIAFAFGLAMLISIAQYLTTLFIGEGRYTTLTLYMISLSSGGSRRMMGSTSMLLVLLNASILIFTLTLVKLQKGTQDVKL